MSYRRSIQTFFVGSRQRSQHRRRQTSVVEPTALSQVIHTVVGKHRRANRRARSHACVSPEQLESRVMLTSQVPLFGEGSFAALDPLNDSLRIRVEPNFRFFDGQLEVEATVLDPETGNKSTVQLDDEVRFLTESVRHTDFIIDNLASNVFAKSGLASPDSSIQSLSFSKRLLGEEQFATIQFQVFRQPELIVSAMAANESVGNTGSDPNANAGEVLVGQQVLYNIEANNFGLQNLTKGEVDQGTHRGTKDRFAIVFDPGNGGGEETDEFRFPFVFDPDALPRPSEFVTTFAAVYGDSGDKTATVRVFRLNETTKAVEGDALLTQEFSVFVREPEFLREGNVLVGEKGLLELDRFDVSFVQSLDPLQSGRIDGNNFQIHVGSVQGRVRDFTRPVVVVLEGFIVHDPLFQFHSFEKSAFSSVLAELMPGPGVDRANMRFALDVDSKLNENFQLGGADPFAGLSDLPHVLNEDLSFVLRDPTTNEELDRIRLSRGQLEKLNILEQPLVTDTDQLNQPFDIDLNIPEVIELSTSESSARLSAEVLAEHMLANLDGPGGRVTLTIDYGDGTNPEVISFDISIGPGGIDVANVRPGVIDPSNPLLPDVALNNIVFVPTSDLRNERFDHDYQETGEFIVTATMSLPNGVVAVDQKTVRVISDADIPREGRRRDLEFSVEHTGAGTAALRFDGFFRFLNPNLELDFTLRAGDRSSTVTQTLTDRSFDVRFDDVNLFDLLNGADQGVIPDLTVTVSGSGTFPVTVPLEPVTLASQAIRFIDFDGFFTFDSVGNLFEIRVPHKDPADPDEPAEVNTVESTRPNGIDAVPPGRALADSGVVVFTSFFRDPVTEQRTVIRTQNFSIEEVIDGPRLLLKNVPARIEEEQPPGDRPEITVRNSAGLVRIEFGDGRTLERTPSSGRVVIEREEFTYDEDPPGGQKTFLFKATLIEGGNVVATIEQPVEVTDKDPIVVVNVGDPTPIRPVGQDGRRVEFNLTVDETVNSGAGTYSFQTQFDGGLQDFDREGATFEIDIDYNQEFLIRVYEQNEVVERFSPGVIFTREDGLSRVAGPQLDFATRIGVNAQSHPEVAFGKARVETNDGFGFEIDTVNVVGNKPVSVELRLPQDLTDRILALTPGEQIVSEIQNEIDRFDLRFTGRTNNFPKAEFVRTFNNEISEVTFNGRVFGSFESTVTLRNPTTGEDVLAFSNTSRLSSVDDPPGDTGPGSFGSAKIAVFPIVDLRVDENGAVQGSVTTTKSTHVPSLFNPATGESVPLEDPDNDMIFRVDNAFPGGFRLGGEVQVLVQQPQTLFSFAARPEKVVLTLPVRFSEFVTQPILVTDRVTGQPPVLKRGEAAKLDIALSEETRALANNPGDAGFVLNVTISDDRKLTLQRSSTLAADRFLVVETLQELPYDPTTGTISSLTPQGEELFTFNGPGLFDVRVFGEDAFGNTIVRVDNLGVSVVPALQVNADGQVFGFVDVNSPVGGTIEILGIIQQFPSGQQRVQFAPTGAGIQPGDQITGTITLVGDGTTFEFATTVDAGEKVKSTLEITVETAANGNKVAVIDMTQFINSIESTENENGFVRDGRADFQFDKGDGSPPLQIAYEFFEEDINVRGSSANVNAEEFVSDTFVNPEIRIPLAFAQTGDFTFTIDGECVTASATLTIDDTGVTPENVTATRGADGNTTVTGLLPFGTADGNLTTTLPDNATVVTEVPGGTRQFEFVIPGLNGGETIRTRFDNGPDVETVVMGEVENQDPIIQNARIVHNGGRSFTISGTATDPDGDAVRMLVFDDQASELPGQIDTNTDGTFALTVDLDTELVPPEGQIRQVRLTADDRRGGIDNEQLTVVPNPAIDHPQFPADKQFGGNVRVTFDNGVLTLEGDAGDNGVVITRTFGFADLEFLVVIPLDGTMINGNQLIFSVQGEVTRIDASTFGQDGDDALFVDGVNLVESNTKSTPGNDIVAFTNVTIANDLSVDVGPEDDIVDLTGATVNGTSTTDLDTGRDSFLGTPGDDIIRVADGGDTINGGDGNDQIIVDAGTRAVRRSGNQIVVGDDDPIILTDVETVQLVNSTDTLLVIDLSENDDNVVLIDNDDGSFTLQDLDGTFGGSMTFIPPAEGVTINGLDGGDTIDFTAATFAVTLNGGSDDDHLTGGRLNDLLNGDAGNDTLIGFLGADQQHGGDGNDLFVWNNGDGPDDNFGEAGDDTFRFNGADGGDDDLRLAPAADAGAGGVGTHPAADFDLTRTLPSAFTIENGGIEHAEINGLAGNDRLDMSAIPANLLTSLTVNGGDGDDVLTGGDADESLNGNNGDDRIVDGHGNDVIDGGPGNDTIVLIPGSNDTVNDPTGTDTLDFSQAERGVNVNPDNTGAAQNVDGNGNGLTLNGGPFENLVGSPFADQIAVRPLDVARTIDGGGNTDVVSVDAGGAAAVRNGDVLEIEGRGLIRLPGVEQINVENAGDQNDEDDGGGNNGDGLDELLNNPDRVPGDVSVTVRRRNLSITGDGFDNAIRVERADDGSIVVTGLGGTTLNGSDEPVVFRSKRRRSWFRQVSITTAQGDDVIQIRHLRVKNLQLNSGGGKDVILSENAVIRKASIDTGEGDDVVDLSATYARRRSRLETGAGNDIVRLRKSHVGSRFHGTTSAGRDRLILVGTRLSRRAQFDLGADNDVATVSQNSIVARNTSVGGGADDDLLESDRTATTGRKQSFASFERAASISHPELLDEALISLIERGL